MISTRAWNQKLFYRFSGGVAIGHDQGKLGIGSPLYDEALSRGYAVAYSTGNRTGVHYNLQLAGETAVMVKDHFVNRFGEPEFTMSIGGSGGAIQQYILAQHHPGLLDGIGLIDWLVHQSRKHIGRIRGIASAPSRKYGK